MVLSDATAEALMEEMKIDRKSAENLVGAVVSIKVSAEKP